MKKTILYIQYSLLSFFEFIFGAKKSSFFSRRKLLIGIAIIGLLKISSGCRTHQHKCYVAVVDPDLKEQTDSTSVQ